MRGAGLLKDCVIFNFGQQTHSELRWRVVDDVRCCTKVEHARPASLPVALQQDGNNVASIGIAQTWHGSLGDWLARAPLFRVNEVRERVPLDQAVECQIEFRLMATGGNVPTRAAGEAT
jgi:hypothetical protein